MFFRQIKYAGDNFSYIVADEKSREAAVVDPSFNGDEIIRIVEKNRLRIEYIVNTHHHRDHMADNDKLKSALSSDIVAHVSSVVRKDKAVRDGDLLMVGSIKIRVIHTPGHTIDGVCLLVNNEKLLTGDTLFVGECGRTDLPGSSSRDMYNSLFGKLMKLPDHVEVYPGHDYGFKPHSTIGEERRDNYVLEERTLEEFLEFMRAP